jgi:hypothetical protein
MMIYLPSAVGPLHSLTVNLVPSLLNTVKSKTENHWLQA